MIRKIFYSILILSLCINISYGASRNYDQELQIRNQQFLESLNGKSHRERKDAIIRQKLEYEREIRNKEDDLYLLGREKHSMNYNEKKEKTKELKKEIEDLRRAINNLR